MTDGDEVDESAAAASDPLAERAPGPARPVPTTYLAHRRAATALVAITGLLAVWLAYGLDLVTMVVNLVPGWFDLLWPF